MYLVLMCSLVILSTLSWYVLASFSLVDFYPQFSALELLLTGNVYWTKVWQPSIGERLVSLNRNFSQMAQVSLLLFDSTSEASFACTKLLLSAISPPSGSRIIMLVATKIDLDSDRAVTREEASEFARSNGLLYAETSAKTGEGVVEAFKTGISASLANANSEGTKKTNTITLQNHPSPAASNCEC